MLVGLLGGLLGILMMIPLRRALIGRTTWAIEIPRRGFDFQLRVAASQTTSSSSSARFQNSAQAVPSGISIAHVVRHQARRRESSSGCEQPSE